MGKGDDEENASLTSAISASRPALSSRSAPLVVDDVLLTSNSREKTLQTFAHHRELLRGYAALQTPPTPFTARDILQASIRLDNINMVVLKSKHPAFKTNDDWANTVAAWVERKHSHARATTFFAPGTGSTVTNALVSSKVHETLRSHVHAQLTPLVVRHLVSKKNKLEHFLTFGFTTKIVESYDLSDIDTEGYSYLGVCVLSGRVRVTIDSWSVDVTAGSSVLWLASKSKSTMRFDPESPPSTPTWLFHFAYATTSIRELYPGLIQTGPLTTPRGVLVSAASFYVQPTSRSRVNALRTNNLPLAVS